MITPLLLIIFTLVLSSCSITPESVLPPTLVQEITKVAVPKITSVNSNNDVLSPSITIAWTPVDNATYYCVEYISANDYLAGNDWIAYIVTEGTTFTLPEIRITNPSDMRFVFRVRAEVVQNSKSIKSDFSNEVEGVVINNFRLNYFVRENKLVVTENFPKTNSVLNQGSKIDKPSVKYYSGNLEDLSKPLDESLLIENINGLVLESNQEREFTAVLIVGEKVVVRKSFKVKNSIDYYPPKLEKMEVPTVDNQVPAITISWVSKPINAGLENAILKFEIQRRVVNLIDEQANAASNVWQSVKDENGNIFYTDLNQYVDKDVQPNKDYFYRVISHYFATIDGQMYQFSQSYNSLIETDAVHINDNQIKTFNISYDDLNWKTVDEITGDATYKVNLDWSAIHELPQSYKYMITQFPYNEISSGNISNAKVIYSGKDNHFTHEIKLTKDEDRKEQSYVFYMQIVKEDATKYDDSIVKNVAYFQDGNQGIIKTIPTEPVVNFIKQDSLMLTGGGLALADTIRINFDMDSKAITESGLQTALVGFKIYRVEDNKSTLITVGHTDFDGVLFGYGLKKDPITGTYYFEDKSDYTKDSIVENDNIPGIVPGVNYQYQILVYYTDTSSPYNGEQTLIKIPGFGNVLEPVSNITASMNTYNSKIEISWSPVANAKGYNIYYKDSNNADAKFEGPINVDLQKATVSETKITFAISENLKVNTIYDITVTATDVSGKDIIKQCDVYAQGSIIGAITPNIENRAKSIYLSWDAILNAKEYNIKIYDKPFDGADPNNGKALSSVQIRATDLMKYEYELTSDSEVVKALLTTDPLALSKSYYFTVTPKSTEAALEAEVRLIGSWTQPPKVIKASKANYSDLIEVEWSPVEGNEGYAIYKRCKGVNEEWKFVQNIPKNVNKHEDFKDIQGEFEYSIATVVNGEEGPMQIGFSENANVGYPILSPKQFTCTDQSTLGGNEYFVYTFRKVMDETKYLIICGNDVINIDLDDKSKNSPELVPGNFQINNSGLVTYVGKRSDVTKSVYSDAKIYTIGKNASLPEKNLSIPATASYAINYVKDYEVINILNTILHHEIITANNNFGGDWWIYNLLSGVGNKYTSEKGNGYFYIETAHSQGSLNIHDGNCGKLIIGQDIFPYSYKGFSLSTKEPVKVWAFENGGYGATNALKDFTGTFILKFPGTFPTKTIRMQSYRADNSDDPDNKEDAVYIVDGTNEVAVDRSKVTVHIL